MAVETHEALTSTPFLRYDRTIDGPQVRHSYAICATPRSGSNFLCEVVASTGFLGKPSEYLHAQALSHRGLPDCPREPQRRVDLALREGTTANGVCAIKVFTHQFDNIGLDWMKAFPNLKLVYLTRGDLLGQALSRARASDQEVALEPRSPGRTLV